MFQYIPSGDSAIIIKAGSGISEEINATVRKLLSGIQQADLKGITDTIPSYNELMVCYDPLRINYKEILIFLQSLEPGIENTILPPSSLIHVPVLYGDESGPDLGEVADFTGLSREEIVKIHSSDSYLVYMLGFTPGFCYLGGMDERIATPRKQSPRLRIPAGSVGIADKQTGIYPIESPGGWQLIGKTPLRLFDPEKKPEFLVEAGDRIKFYPVEPGDFEKIAYEINEGTFVVERTKLT